VIHIAAALGALTLAFPAAADVTAGVTAGVGVSDNIARTNSNEIDETLATVGFNFAGTRPEGKLTGRVNAAIEYISYLDNTYDDDFYGRADLLGDYSFVEDLFSWRVEDSWGQIRSDPFSVQSPENSENTNYFATGPDVTLRLGSRTRFLVTGRWSDTSYETSSRDYTRLGGGLGLSRDLSDRTELGIHGYTSRVEFDDSTFGSDYDAQEYLVRLTTEGARTRILLDAGYTQIHDQGSSSGNPLFRLTASRDVGARSELTLTAGTEFSDAGQVFQGSGASGGASGFGGGNAVIGVGDPFERRYFGLGWSLQGQRSRFSVGADYRQELYETLSAIDREVTEFYAELNRGLTQSLRINLGARYLTEKYDDDSVDDDRLSANAGLAWDFSQKFYVSAAVELYQSNSNSSLREYDENRAWLRIGYRAR
jgi:hypothetical protein